MILVTGGTGLVGSHLLYKLISEDKKVIAVTRDLKYIKEIECLFKFYSKEYKNHLNKISWIEGDLNDNTFVYSLLKNVKKVYHCAAEVTFEAKKRKGSYSNFTITRNIVNACLANDIKKLCHVSSIAALPSSENGKAITEKDGWPKENYSAYADGKTKSEFEVFRGIQEGLDAVIVIPSVIIGPGRFDRGSGRIFSTVYNGLNYYTEGSAGFIDVFDVADIMIKLMESEYSGERYLISGGNLSFKLFLELIAKYLKVKPPEKYISKKSLEKLVKLESLKSFLLGTKQRIHKDGIGAMTTKNIYDPVKIKELLDYSFLSVERAIERTSEYFRFCQNI